MFYCSRFCRENICFSAADSAGKLYVFMATDSAGESYVS